MTDAEAAAGLAAAEAYEGWPDAEVIGVSRDQEMVQLIITTADAATDQSVAGRQDAALSALTDVVTKAGYIDEVPDGLLAGVATAVLAAVAGLRAQRT